jgi:hypothetical protein
MRAPPAPSLVSASLVAAVSLVALIVGSAWLLPVAAAQTANTGQAASPSAAAASRSGKALRTSWGHPDLQGTWTNATTTPLERPAQFAGKAWLTDEERRALDARAAEFADRKPRAGDTGAYNSFWLDNGAALNQTSLIVEPPDGKLPALTPDAKREEEALEVARKEPPGTWEDLNWFERCITRGMPGSMMPGFYNHNYQIVQTPTYVALQVEMSGFRIIPIDGRPHISPTIRQWLGDSRGRWEGDTLVVETTNLTDRVHERRRSNTVFGGSDRMTLVERFTRVDENTIDYRFTVTDPKTFAQPWTASIPMRKIDSPIFEYGCHEANYSLPNILRGARQMELEKAAGTSESR